MLYVRFPLSAPPRTAAYNMLQYNTYIGVFGMLTKGSVEIGIETRFGPDWPGVRCGVKTKAGDVKLLSPGTIINGALSILGGVPDLGEHSYVFRVEFSCD